MKSTDPLSIPPGNFKLQNNSADAKGIGSREKNAKNDSPLSTQLVGKEMIGTACAGDKISDCDTNKLCVKVDVHKVNGYSTEDDESKSASKEREGSLSSSNSNTLKSSDVVQRNRSNDVFSSDIKSDNIKINRNNRDSAVFDDIDLNTDCALNTFEGVTNPKLEPIEKINSDSGEFVKKVEQKSVLDNGICSVKVSENSSQSLNFSKNQETKPSVFGAKQNDVRNTSIVNAGVQDTLKNAKKSILGFNGLGDHDHITQTSSSSDVLKNAVLGCDNSGIHKFSNGESHLAKASSLESLSENGGRFERYSEIRRSKSSINGLCSVRSRSDPDADLEYMLLPGGEQLNEGYDNLPVDSGVESAASSWDRMAEVKETAHARLQEELRKAHHKLKLKDEEVSRLSRIRNEVEAELEELTASLFQEAHNMVREANVQQAAAEKALKESHMQIDVLTAEVAALKTLVLTSTPSRPNPHLHPQIDPKSKEDPNNSGSSLFRKQHRRSPSHFNLKYGRENSPPDSPSKELNVPQSTAESSDNPDMLEVDPNLHREFLAWKQSPTLERRDDPFVARVFREDIDGCLQFNNRTLAERVSEAIQSESICIEAVSDKSRSHFPKKCALLEATRQCHYRMRFDGSEQTYCISQLCRNRITAVCNFLNYLRYIQRGLVKSSVHEMYWEIIRLRKEIALARLGLTSTQ